MQMQLVSRLRATGIAISVAAMLSLAACGSGSSGASATGSKTLTFGLSTIQSGPYAVYGQVGQGIDAYFKMIDAKGGVNGYKLQLDSKDNAYQSNQAVSITRAFTDAGDLGIFELGTPATQAALSSGGSGGVPLLCAGNGDLFSPPAVPNAFTVDPQFSKVGLFEAQFIMQNLKQKDFAFAYENDDIGTPAAKVEPSYVSANGGRLLATVPIDATATDFSASAQRLKSSGATVVQALVGTAAFAGLQKAADAIGYHPKWVTFFTQMSPSYPQLVGNLANGVYADNFMVTTGPAEAEFTKAIKQYYPDLATSQFAQLGWSLAAFTVQALQNASANGATPTRASLVQALSSLNGVKAGLLPSVTFNSQSHAAGTQSAMYEYENGVPKKVTDYSDLPSAS